MKSHQYSFSARKVAPLIIWPTVTVLTAALAMRLALDRDWLPRPRPSGNVDQTVLTHQAMSARQPSQARLLLVGDSSCLMNVNARRLEQEIGVDCLNLGTFSDLGLREAGWLVDDFQRTNRSQPDIVLVLMHPDSLRRAGTQPQVVAFLEHIRRGTSPPPSPGGLGRVQEVLGLHDFRIRVYDRLIPAALPGAYGRMYGFSQDLESWMRRNHGSLLDPRQGEIRGNPEYRLASTWKESSRQFRSVLAQRTRLAVGITPVPQSLAPAGYGDRHREMLNSWAEWMEADLALTLMPAVLPDGQFVSVAHLRKSAVQTYTAQLGKELAAWEGEDEAGS